MGTQQQQQKQTKKNTNNDMNMYSESINVLVKGYRGLCQNIIITKLQQQQKERTADIHSIITETVMKIRCGDSEA